MFPIQVRIMIDTQKIWDIYLPKHVTVSSRVVVQDICKKCRNGVKAASGIDSNSMQIKERKKNKF